MRKFFLRTTGLLLLGGVIAWFLSAPRYVSETVFDGLEGSIENGRQVFAAAGCASCHAAPGAAEDAKLILAGGLPFKTEFGTFFAPNISPDETFGIGTWDRVDLANAMIRGTSPKGTHYYPAFPYTSYSRTDPQDIADLYAYLQTLQPSTALSKAHEVGFPFNISRGIGLWKLVFLTDAPVVNVSPDLARGQYLVEGLGHCAECHTPRNAVGGLKHRRWLAGGPNPDGEGQIPNITPHDTAIGGWSEDEIVEYLATGFTPEFDVVGGSMADVVENTAKLSDSDRRAIAQYLKAVPAIAKN